ncbi:hypothetical protein QY96_01763 [Bacillus thermotolerans]|uniref:Uncharacterized protein n=1 Tax=Bacillus thermotolerans TaxID=1221996 RepID=A0A0F5I9M7_BACTR|nr:hypothetical protein QY96_01763 [Bacillus thermotolerans]KKB42226.1 hypothetical protein QY95_00075 [Bacillus thermotolerans]
MNKNTSKSRKYKQPFLINIERGEKCEALPPFIASSFPIWLRSK